MDIYERNLLPAEKRHAYAVAVAMDFLRTSRREGRSHARTIQLSDELDFWAPSPSARNKALTKALHTLDDTNWY